MLSNEEIRDIATKVERDLRAIGAVRGEEDEQSPRYLTAEELRDEYELNSEEWKAVLFNLWFQGVPASWDYGKGYYIGQPGEMGKAIGKLLNQAMGFLRTASSAMIQCEGVSQVMLPYFREEASQNLGKAPQLLEAVGASPKAIALLTDGNGKDSQ